MCDTIAAISWRLPHSEYIRLFIASNGQVTEHSFTSGRWTRNSWSVPGSGVAATACEDGTGRIYPRVFIVNNGEIVEYEPAPGGGWTPRVLRVPGVAATATSFAAGLQVIVRVYARQADGTVVEHCWDGTGSWYPGGYSGPKAVENGLAAISWIDGTNWLLRVYSSDGTSVTERAWNRGWWPGQFSAPGRSLAATAWRGENGQTRIRVYASQGDEIVEHRGVLDAWEHRTWITPGVDAAATSPQGGAVRVYVRGAGGDVTEHKLDGEQATIGATFSAGDHSTRWFMEGSTIREASSPGPFIVRGVCYRRPLIGKPCPEDFLPSETAVWQNDLNAMRAMGVNTIKVYGMIPDHVSTRAHKPFLDYAWNDGDQPIYLLLSVWIPSTLLGRRSGGQRDTAFEGIRQRYVDVVEAYGSHSAVMGFSIGAEVNDGSSLRTTNDFWDDFLDIAHAVRTAAPNRIVTTGLIQDKPSIRLALQRQQSRGSRLIDVWGLDFYKHPQYMNQTVTEFETLIQEFDQTAPLLVAEFGFPASSDNGGEDAQRAHLVATWDVLRARRPFVCGGCIFSWADEWCKEEGRPLAAHDLGTDRLFDFELRNDNGQIRRGEIRRDEEWFGINALTETEPDCGRTLIPRAAYHAFRTSWP